MKDPYMVYKQCLEFKTMDCPNSLLCLSTKDKPFFEKKENENLS